MMKKLKEYLDGGGVFSEMTDSHITVVASQLDAYLKIEFGFRTLGAIIPAYEEEDGTVTAANRTAIAQLVYSLYKEKWEHYFDYIDADIKSWQTGNTKTTVAYGKRVNDTSSDKDTTTRSDTIAGFDSAADVLVDDSARKTVYEYGRKDASQQSGTDTITVESTSGEPDSLVQVALQFWSKYGLFKMLCRDAAHALCLHYIQEEEI